MKIITKYNEYLKLLESKKSDDFLRNYRNGLDFYLTEEVYNYVDINIENYELILKRLKMSSNFLKYDNGVRYGKKSYKSKLSFNLFLNTTEQAGFGEVYIRSLKQNDELHIDDDNYYLITFIYKDYDASKYVCYGDIGIKKCIVYNVLYNTEINGQSGDNQMFYSEILNLLKSKEVDEVMNWVDFDEIVWYNSPDYIEYALSNDLFDINENKFLSNFWYLVEKGNITKQDFVNKHSNWFLLKDGEVYIRSNYSELSELSFMFSKDDNDRNHISSREFIESIYENDFFRESTKFEYLYLDILKPESLKVIEGKIQEIKLTLDQEDQQEFDEYDNWEEQVKNIDSLYDLKNGIEDAFRYAQESADSDEMYEAAKKPILNLFGMEELLRDEKDHYIFKLNKDFLIRFDNYWYGEYKSINYGNKINELIIDRLFETIRDDDDSVEFLKIDFPYYGFDGSIDKNYLHECIVDKLNEI